VHSQEIVTLSQFSLRLCRQIIQDRYHLEKALLLSQLKVLYATVLRSLGKRIKDVMIYFEI